MRVLVVIDMQNDFVDGALGTKEAEAIVQPVTERVKQALRNNELLIFTRDTHTERYLSTQEGKNLPVKHCIVGSHGRELIDALLPYAQYAKIFDKPAFGSLALMSYLKELATTQPIEQITIIGLCTDICVISNAFIIKAGLPEVPLVVEEKCCAGVTPESHTRALEAMKVCQVHVKA